MEHLHHFDLRQDPFKIEPDLRIYFDSPSHCDAQRRVERGLRQAKGLTVMTGEDGTGKTLLARRILNELEEEVFEASLMVMLPGAAEAAPVLQRFARQLGVEQPADDRAALMVQIYEMLAAVREEGRHSVLILDDAHLLGAPPMAEIGGLLNLEYEDRRLLSILLVGLPVLDDSLLQQAALESRVDVRVRLQPLDFENSAAYLEHRLQAAGGRPDILSAEAVERLFQLGGGRPRLMNTLADNALFEAFLGKRVQIAGADVDRAAVDLGIEGARAAVPAPQAPTPTAEVADPVLPTPTAEVADPVLPTPTAEVADPVLPTPTAEVAEAPAPSPELPSLEAAEEAPAFDIGDAQDLASLEVPEPEAPAFAIGDAQDLAALEVEPEAPAFAIGDAQDLAELEVPEPEAPALEIGGPDDATTLLAPEPQAPMFEIGDSEDLSFESADALGADLAGPDFDGAELELEVEDALEGSLLGDSVEDLGALLDEAEMAAEDDLSTLLVASEDAAGVSSTLDLDDEVEAVLAVEPPSIDALPTFDANNASHPVMADATRIAIPEEGPPKDSTLDELDDLFVELIED